ncbi:hypothetical protein [Saccharothrix texasensis]|uniref:Uncharacterized protein n=1 Tax=Saccharothrix texasensis TaxID=103734 RepID=A0A3N1H221_9PSEU|nr:hypothetical protein [Saccharothrix texasensis]ROP36302.1 hypothetical protein EDD40_1567 [Saccharothrix texasensis]
MSDIGDINTDLSQLAHDIGEALQLAGAAGRQVMDTEPSAATVAAESVRAEAQQLPGLMAQASDRLAEAVQALGAAHTIAIVMAAS